MPKAKRAAKRGNGEGSKVMPHASGLKRADVSLGYDGEGKRIRQTVYGRTDAEVIAKKNELLAQHGKGLTVNPDKVTLGEWLEKWLAGQRPHLSERSRELYATTLRLYVPKHLKETRLQAVTRAQVKDLAADLAARELSASTRGKVMQHLRAAFEEAIDQELLVKNPTRNIRVRATAAETAKRRNAPDGALPDEELDRFLSAAEGDPLYPLFYTLFSLGLRRGEGLGLRWADIDRRTPSVRVAQQVKVVDGKAVLGPLKTDGSYRAYTPSPDLLAVLEARREAQRADREALGDAWTETGLVFTTALGTMLHPRNVNRSIERVIEKANARALELYVQGEGVPVERHPTHGFILGTPALAKGLGVSANTVRVLARERREIVEGKHRVAGEKRNGGRPVTLWTRAGALLVAELVGGERAAVFRRALEAYALPEASEMPVRHFSSHAGRKTASTNLRRDGVPLETVASLMGHSLEVALKHYRSVSDEERRRTIHSLAERRNGRPWAEA